MTMNEIERILKMEREEPYKIIVLVRSFGCSQKYEFDEAERALIVCTMLYRLGCSIEWIKFEEMEQEDEEMLNIDKYREQILKLVNDKGFSGATAICTVADVNDYRKALEWAISEYNPCLKNGDGLKPGDKIMVRDNNGQKWAQATYLFYFNETFYCVDGVRYIAEEGNFVNWLQARLPKEGE